MDEDFCTVNFLGNLKNLYPSFLSWRPQIFRKHSLNSLKAFDSFVKTIEEKNLITKILKKTLSKNNSYTQMI